MVKIRYEDFKNICRMCMLDCDTNFNKDSAILDIFHKLTDIHFDANDELPQKICFECFDFINEIHSFSMISKQTHFTLIECLNNYKNKRINEELETIEVTTDDETEKKNEITIEEHNDCEELETIELTSDEEMEIKDEISINEHKIEFVKHELHNDCVTNDSFNEKLETIEETTDEEMKIKEEITIEEHQIDFIKDELDDDCEINYSLNEDITEITNELLMPNSEEEEEIDVVSVEENQQTTGFNCNTILPTNPLIRDRRKLQRTAASATSYKYNNQVYPQSGGGIKTRLPLRKPNTRGVKRGRHHRYQKTSFTSSPNTSSGSNNGGGFPAKRRRYALSSDSDTESSDKRSLHNIKERYRRGHLRNGFDDLRVLVPKVACIQRASKVHILGEAAAYCDFLGNQSVNQLKQLAELRRQQAGLRARVSQLRQSLAVKR